MIFSCLKLQFRKKVAIRINSRFLLTWRHGKLGFWQEQIDSVSVINFVPEENAD